MQPGNKREVVEAMLAKGDTMICLDSRYPDVQVPESHQGKEDLRLVLNLNFRHSITTFPEGIQAELLFGGVPYLCWIPYESLWAVYNPQTGEGYLWPGKTPVSLRDLLGDEPEGDETERKTKRGEPGPPISASPKSLREKETALAPESLQEATQQTKTARPPKSRKRDTKESPRFRVIKGGKKG